MSKHTITSIVAVYEVQWWVARIKSNALTERRMTEVYGITQTRARTWIIRPARRGPFRWLYFHYHFSISRVSVPTINWRNELISYETGLINPNDPVYSVGMIRPRTRLMDPVYSLRMIRSTQLDWSGLLNSITRSTHLEWSGLLN